MAQVTATIASKVGLHARPAATFVKAVAEKGIPVTIAKEGGAAVDASSILGVMTLGAGFGDVITLASDTRVTSTDPDTGRPATATFTHRDVDAMRVSTDRGEPVAIVTYCGSAV